MSNSGYTTTSALSDSIETMISSARNVREYEGVMTQLAEKVTLPSNSGEAWNEITLSQVTAQAVTETTKLDNPQQVTDTKFPLTPTMVGLHIVILDKIKRRLSKKVLAKLGGSAQVAIERKKDEDGLVLLDGAGTSLAGAGTTLTSGHIDAGVVQITSNTTEPGKPPIYVVLHGYQIRDIADEIKAGLGTYAIPEGLTANVFKNGIRGVSVTGAQIFEDGNITIDSAADAKGGIFAKEGVILVQGKSPWQEPRREPDLGGGADSFFHYDEFVYGERLAAGTTSAFLFEVYSDATAPTS